MNPDPSPADAASSFSAFEDLLAGKTDAAAKGTMGPPTVVPPAPDDPVAHAQILTNLRTALAHQLRAETLVVLPTGMTVRAKGNVGEFAYQPDLIVDASLPPAGAASAREPLVVFEVAAPGSERAAFVESWQIQQSLPSVAAHVLVDPTQPGVTLQRRTSKGWKTETMEDASDEIFLPTIHATIPLETVYAGVFSEEEED